MVERPTRGPARPIATLRLGERVRPTNSNARHKQNGDPRRGGTPKAAVVVWQWAYCGGCTSTDPTSRIAPPQWTQ